VANVTHLTISANVLWNKATKVNTSVPLHLLRCLGDEKLSYIHRSASQIQISVTFRNFRLSVNGTGRELCYIHEGVSKSFRTGRLEQELQIVQLSAIGCSCIAIL
jgi:hypothetical protein